jgi:hypothetical protein
MLANMPDRGQLPGNHQVATRVLTVTESVHSICSFGPSGIIGSTPHCQHLAELPNRVVPALRVFQRQRRRDVLPNRLAVGSAARIRDHQRKQQHQEGAVPHHPEHVLRSENLTPAGRCPLLRAAVVGRLARGPAESHRVHVSRRCACVPAGPRCRRGRDPSRVGHTHSPLRSIV